MNKSGKNKPNKLVPKLRFPEFSSAGEWPYLHGHLLFRQISSKKHNSDLPILAITQEHGAIPRHEIDYNVTVSDKSVESYKVVEVGDFIISLRSFQGGIEYSNYKGICSPAYIILRKQNEAVDQFFKYYFKTDLFIRDLNKNLEGLRDGKMVSYKQFSDLLLPIPSVPEQQKVADCLSSVDDLITEHSQKLDALKAYKKGLTQQLFPAKGENLPKLRFSEFQDIEDWEKVQLTDIANFSSGGTPSKDASTYWGGDIPWISASSMYSTTIENSDLNITETAVKDGARIAKKGVLLILVRGSMLYKRIPMGITTKAVAFNQDVKALTLTNGVINYFLLYQLMSAEKQLLDAVTATGIGAGKLDSDDLKQFPIYIPSKKEQQKIADCFFAADELINAQSQKLDALKSHKKGLMHQLFPFTSETSK